MHKGFEKKIRQISEAVELATSIPENVNTEWLDYAKKLTTVLYGIGNIDEKYIDMEALGRAVFESARRGATRFDLALINGDFINKNEE